MERSTPDQLRGQGSRALATGETPGVPGAHREAGGCAESSDLGRVGSSVRFEIPGPVVGKQRPKVGRRGGHVAVYTPEKTVSYEALVKLAAQAAMSGRQPLAGAVEVNIVMLFDIPKSFSRIKRAQAITGELKPIVKPDIDNVCKAILDACNGTVYRDDAQATDANLRKRYGLIPGAYVEVRPL